MTALVRKPASGKQKMLFFKQYLQNPRDVGSVMPSGARLTDMMVKALALAETGKVVELGPGTGAFTRALIEAGVAPERLILVERNTDFAAFLTQEFPGVTVRIGDAQELDRILAKAGEGTVQRIVSGLPLRSMDDDIRLGIARAVAASLAPGGRLVQFTYLSGPPISRKAAAEAGLLGARFGVALGNVPPAFVWQYVRMS
jgi:phosphatidylethanolamine/phosphatidyl-N-methylethanolamine N-methyltransferase